MKKYQATLTGMNPLIMHKDNFIFMEKISGWRKDPANKSLSTRGDDRSPAWTWISCLYHDGENLAMEADNLMTMIREAATKVGTGKGKESFKKRASAGIMLEKPYAELFVNGQQIPIGPIDDLISENDFDRHITAVESMGFRLLVKRARIEKSKHIRVRPIFDSWHLQFDFVVLDEEFSGLTMAVLESIFDIAGALIGIGDWRPSSLGSPGFFGKFDAKLKKAK